MRTNKGSSVVHPCPLSDTVSVSPSLTERTVTGTACTGMHKLHKSRGGLQPSPAAKLGISPRHVLAVATAQALAWNAVLIPVKFGVAGLHRGYCLSAGLKGRARLGQGGTSAEEDHTCHSACEDSCFHRCCRGYISVIATALESDLPPRAPAIPNRGQARRQH